MKRYGSLSLVAALFTLVLAGCHSSQNPTNANSAQAEPAGDPADANLVPASNVTNAPDTQNPPPPPADQQDNAAPPPSGDQGYDQAGYDQSAGGQDYDDTAYDVASDPPPPIPDYDQPPCPGDDYIWTPGYWSYASAGYYWVPGQWVMAPWVGALWTPGYWGFYQNRYHWYPGYWGPHIGFYGGVNYGYGYDGTGYEGGYWRSNHFYYNTALTHVNSGVHDTYDYRVNVNNNSRVSYNGGHGGLSFRPTPAQAAARNEHHVAPLPSQRDVAHNAQQNRGQFANNNNGHPQTVAETRPGNDGRSAPAPRAQDFHPTPAPHARPTAGNDRNQHTSNERTNNGAPPPHAGPASGHENPVQRPTAHPVENNHAAPQAQPAARPQPNERTRQPNLQRSPGPRPAPVVRPAPTQNQQPRPNSNEHPAPNRPAAPEHNQPRVQPNNRPAPQPHTENRPQPQPHQDTNRPQPHPDNKKPDDQHPHSGQ